MKKLSWKQIVDAVQVLGVIAAIIISCMSYWVSKRAYDETHRDFIGHRLAVWRGDAKGDSLSFASTSEAVQPQFLSLKFPKKITTEEFQLYSPDFRLYKTRFEYAVRSWLVSNTTPKAGYVTVIEGLIPVLIHSRYSCAGDICEDEGLYAIHYIYVVPELGKANEPVDFEGIAFIGRAGVGQGEKNLESYYSDAVRSLRSKQHV